MLTLDGTGGTEGKAYVDQADFCYIAGTECTGVTVSLSMKASQSDAQFGFFSVPKADSCKFSLLGRAVTIDVLVESCMCPCRRGGPLLSGEGDWFIQGSLFTARFTGFCFVGAVVQDAIVHAVIL